MYHYPSFHSLEFQFHIFRPFVSILQLLDILICFRHSFFSVCLSYVIPIELSSSSLSLSSAVSLLLMSQLKALFISVGEFLCHLIFFLILFISLLKFSHLTLHTVHLLHQRHIKCSYFLCFFSDSSTTWIRFVYGSVAYPVSLQFVDFSLDFSCFIYFVESQISCVETQSLR